MHEGQHLRLQRQHVHPAPVGRLGSAGFHNGRAHTVVRQRQGHMVGLHHHHRLQSGHRVLQSVCQHAAQRIAHVQADERQVCQVAQADGTGRTLRRLQHAAGHHAHQRVAGQAFFCQRRMGRGTEDKTDICFLQHQCIDDLR